MNRSGRRVEPRRRCDNRHALALAAALLALACAREARAAAGAATKPASSCVACHTDAARLQAEAKGIPPPPASTLQSGKG